MADLQDRVSEGDRIFDELQDGRASRAEWIGHFRVGEVTLRVESELPVPMDMLGENLRAFSAEGPGEDTVVLRHVFRLPEIDRTSLGKLVYKGSPWEVWHGPRGWAYLLVPSDGSAVPFQIGVFSEDHCRGVIFHRPRLEHAGGGVHSLTLFPTDQILLAQLFADRNGVLLHSSAAILGGRGILFLGPSGAGKSTTMKMIRERATILCDDRNIVRMDGGGYRVHGTWSHGELPDVSSASASLAAMFVLRQSPENRLSPRLDRRKAFAALIGRIVRSAETPEWWAKTVSILWDLVESVPVFEMSFDQSGLIVNEIEGLLAKAPCPHEEV